FLGLGRSLGRQALFLGLGCSLGGQALFLGLGRGFRCYPFFFSLGPSFSFRGGSGRCFFRGARFDRLALFLGSSLRSEAIFLRLRGGSLIGTHHGGGNGIDRLTRATRHRCLVDGRFARLGGSLGGRHRGFLSRRRRRRFIGGRHRGFLGRGGLVGRRCHRGFLGRCLRGRRRFRSRCFSRCRFRSRCLFRGRRFGRNLGGRRLGLGRRWFGGRRLGGRRRGFGGRWGLRGLIRIVVAGSEGQAKGKG